MDEESVKKMLENHLEQIGMDAEIIEKRSEGYEHMLASEYDEHVEYWDENSFTRLTGFGGKGVLVMFFFPEEEAKDFVELSEE